MNINININITMSIPISSSHEYRLKILGEAGKVYSDSGKFFDSIMSIRDINLTELGFDTIDSINIDILNTKIRDFMSSDEYTNKKFVKYNKLKTYIEFKNFIEKLNLPEEIKSIKVRSEYQKEVVCHFITTRWEQYIEGSHERLSIALHALTTNLTLREKETYANNIPLADIYEIENRCKPKLLKSPLKFKLKLELGGSIRKRKYNSRRRPHRRTSRK
jgi:hypothetical protein